MEMMNELSALLILSFPLAFLLHEAEEMITVQRWMLRNRDYVEVRFPFAKGAIRHLAELNSVAFGIAVAEELLIVMLSSIAFLCYTDEWLIQHIWMGVTGAFSIHLLVHVGQAIALRRYTPGLVSTLVLLPYCGYLMHAIAQIFPMSDVITTVAIGCVLAAVNLPLAHKLGMAVSKHTKLNTYRLL